MSVLRLQGVVSGFCDIQSANAAGSVTVTTPTQSGNLVVVPVGSVVGNGKIILGNTNTGQFQTGDILAGSGITVTPTGDSITIAATGGAATDQFARDHANGAFDKANGAIYTATQIRANISNTAPINYDSTTGVISHAASGVTATGYGDAATIPVVVVNATGHVTSVVNTSVAITASQITSGTLSVSRGGTSNSTSPANGAIPIGNTVSGGYDINRLTAGPNIIITNDKGSITIEASSGSSTDQFARDRANGAFTTANAATPNTATTNGQIYAGNSISGQFDLTTLAQTAPVIVTNGRGTITLSHASSGVTATTYGNASHISQMIVDQYGHITTAANVLISIDTTQIVSGVLSVARGGIANSTSPANGAIPIGNTVSGGYDINTLTQGTGIVITNDKGSITIAATGGSATDQYARDTANAANVLAQTARDQANGAFDKANGAIYTAAQIRANISNTYPVYYNSTTGVISFVPATTNGQLLIGNTVSGTFDVNTLTQGTGGITIVNDKGSITISDSTRFTKGLSVFTPNVSDNITCFWTSNTMTMRQCVSVVQGTNPNVTYRLSYSNTRATGTVGTAITGDIVCANTTNGVFTTTFSNGTVPANNYLFLQFPSVANTVTEFALTVEYTM